MSDSKVTSQPERSYVLGHSDRKLARLKVQARLIGPITRGFMRDSGIEPGKSSRAGFVGFAAFPVDWAATVEAASSNTAASTARHMLKACMK